MTRIIVYDGECSMCIRSVRALVGLRLVEEDGVAAWDDLEGDEAQRTWDAGFRNEMAVLDRETGEIRSGVHGLMWVLRRSWLAPLAVVFDLPGVRNLTAFVYRTVAYNRRVLAPPPTRGFVCACDPDEHRGYQWSLILSLSILYTAVAAALGAAATRYLQAMPAETGAIAGSLACGLGWLPPALASLRLEPAAGRKYLGNLAVTAFSGAVFLLPATIGAPWTGRTAFVVLAASGIAVGFVWMGRALRRRLFLLGLGPGWLLLWALSLPAAFAATIGIVGSQFAPR